MEEIPNYHITGIKNIDKDFKVVKALMMSRRSKFFGPPPRTIYIGREFFRGYATHRMIIREKEGDFSCIGYAQFSHYPLIEALPKDCWTNWLNHHFCTLSNAQLSVANTIFFNRFIYNDLYMPQLLMCVLSECFFREPKVRYIAVLQMPEMPNLHAEDVSHYDCLEPIGKVLYPREFSVLNCKNTQRIHIIHRDTIIPKMRYRKALPEDNDDIVEVIDKDRPDLREKYGDFYIAEELLKEEDEKDEHNVFIVTEVSHQTIGFIWLNDDVDILKLVKNFELEPFGNLVKCNHNERTLSKRLKVTCIERKPKHSLFPRQAIEDLFNNTYMGKFLTRRKASQHSLHSKSLLKVTSHQGFIHTSNERFTLREEFLSKMQKIEEKLRNFEYYRIQFEKRLRFRYNVPEVHTYARDADFPVDAYSNAFALQLFGINTNNDLRRLSRFLATSFAAFPERDYCIFSMPSSGEMTRCLRQLLNMFILVMPRPKSIINDYLYITHRSSIYGDITVKHVRPEDVPQLNAMMTAHQRTVSQRTSEFSVTSLASNTSIAYAQTEMLDENKLREKVLDDVFNNPESEYTFLTIRCGNALRPIDDNFIVGYCILRPFMQLHKLSRIYQINQVETYMNFSRAEVISLKLHPLYSFNSDIIFREIASVSSFWDFYYIYPTECDKKRFTNDLCSHMQPIEPRLIRTFHKANFPPVDSDIVHLVEPVNYATEKFALYQQNLKPLRYLGNVKPIVILGFADMCKAFLRLLIFNFNSSEEKNCFCSIPHPKVIVIVQPGVLEAEYDTELKCNICPNYHDCWVNFRNCNNFIRDTMKRTDLRLWVNFVSSKIKMINREKNMILLENDCEIFYDKLLLCPTTDFGLPKDFHDAVHPPNFSAINNRLDKILVYHKVDAIKADKNQNEDISIIVFGAHVRAFEFINFLVKHNVPSNQIKLVIPFDPAERHLHMLFNIPYADLKIESILLEMVEDLGVKIYDRLTLQRWVRYPNDENISHVVFLDFPERNEVVLECDLFVSFFDSLLDRKNIELYQNSGIRVEDGFVIVDENFRTNDPSIYSLGRCTRPIVIPNHQYTYVAPQERAEKLLRILKLDQLERENDDSKFKMPAFFKAQLPMDYYFTKITMPKRYLANHLTNEYGISMVTYDGDFTRVRINEHGILEEIVVVTKIRRNLDHLQHFVGKHESLLNDLHSRWYLGEIPNFLKFFEEPWTELIMHRDFSTLHQTIKNMCQEAAKDIYLANSEMERKSRKEHMRNHLNQNGTTSEVEKVFLDFLRQNRTDFVHPFALPEDFSALP